MLKNNIKITGSTGAIYKSHPKSWFVKHYLEKWPDSLFNNPNIVILQIVQMGSFMFAEVITKADYEAENVVENG